VLEIPHPAKKKLIIITIIIIIIIKDSSIGGLLPVPGPTL
jgi:hypothetical protein